MRQGTQIQRPWEVSLNTTRNGILVLALVLASCSPEETEDLGPSHSNDISLGSTEGQALVSSSDAKALFVVNAVENMITRVQLADRSTTFIPLEGEPSRITRANGLILVSLRTARQIALFQETDSSLEEVGRIDVGAEPVGIVAQKDGSAFYVASSMSGLVQEFDPNTGDELRTWTIPGQPRSLVLHPSGEALYVASTFGGMVHWIDLASGEVSPLAFMERQIFSPRTGELLPATVRITGDMGISPDGSQLGIPMAYINAQTSIPDGTNTNDSNSEPRPPEEGEGYSKRVNPAVVLVDLSDDGSPKPNEETPMDLGLREPSYLSSIRFSPDGALVAATMEGVNSVVLLPTSANHGPPLREVGFSSSPVAVVHTDAGPSSVLFTSDDEIEIYAFLDRTIGNANIQNTRREFVTMPSPGSDLPSGFQLDEGKAVSSITVAQSDLPEEVELGRRLFYAANDPKVSRPGSAISCATCHFEGRTDGLSWPFDRGLRQTPSLAGLVSIRAPVGWAGQQETVALDAMNTSQSLMGGLDLQMHDAEAIAAYIDWSRPVDLPLAGTLDAQARRGQAIFNRPDVGCGDCHGGALLSDGEKHDLLGFVGVKTPSLVGVSATAPYFHDGSAATLREVVLRTDEKGFSADLSDSEIDDLVHYLRTL